MQIAIYATCITLLTLLPTFQVEAQNASAMSEVQTVFARSAQGNAFFNRNLRKALEARGLRFTRDKSKADAFLDSSGRSLKDGGFAGQMTFVGRGGKVLRREKVVRSANSNAMAYRSLAEKMRFVR